MMHLSSVFFKSSIKKQHVHVEDRHIPLFHDYLGIHFVDTLELKEWTLNMPAPIKINDPTILKPLRK